MSTPNGHELALLTWLIVYPMITILLAALDPLLSDLEVPVRTLFLTLILVPAMVYVAMPFATSRLRVWLHQVPHPKSP